MAISRWSLYNYIPFLCRRLSLCPLCRWLPLGLLCDFCFPSIFLRWQSPNGVYILFSIIVGVFDISAATIFCRLLVGAFHLYISHLCSPLRHHLPEGTNLSTSLSNGSCLIGRRSLLLYLSIQAVLSAHLLLSHFRCQSKTVATTKKKIINR